MKVLKSIHEKVALVFYCELKDNIDTKKKNNANKIHQRIYMKEFTYVYIKNSCANKKIIVFKNNTIVLKPH